MGLYYDVKKLIEDEFGEFSSAKIDIFAKQINPEKSPKEFLDKCSDFISTMLGDRQAREKLKKLYKEYT
jgi:hypothetical protein